MTRETVAEKLADIFRDVFDDESLTVDDRMTAADVDGWDSLMHISLVTAIENAFGVSFTLKEVTGMHNVGDMIDLVTEKTHEGV